MILTIIICLSSLTLLTFVPSALISIIYHLQQLHDWVVVSNRSECSLNHLGNHRDSLKSGDDGDEKRKQRRKNRIMLMVMLMKSKNILCKFILAQIKLITEMISLLILFYGKVMHSYEVVGIENVPAKGPILLIGYHGIMPTDLILAHNQIYRRYGRWSRSVGDRFLFIASSLVDEYVFSGPLSKCIDVLQKGHILTITPGGTREAQFATKKYEILWNNRCGFAKAAQQSQTNIVPVFTQNVRQVYLLPETLQKLLRPLYERFRIPMVPFWGGFPVKLRTYFGEPISFSRAETPEELAKLAEESLAELIRKNQKFPATISNAFRERFRIE